MYFVMGKESEDFLVTELRRFFLDVSSYGWVFNKDYSMLGTSYKDNKEGNPYHLISTQFPDKFRFYPNILVKTSVQRFSKNDVDNIITQLDEISPYGKRTTDTYIRGGQVTLGLNITVRAMDQAMAEELADLLSLWSVYNGREILKQEQWFIEPFTYPGGVSVENMKDSTGQKKIYRVNLSTTILCSWLIKDAPSSDYISQVPVEVDFTN